MPSYLQIFLTVALVHLLAVISPGPDFMMITRNSVIYSRKTGIFSAIGLALGILVHITYCLVGIGYLISKSPVIFNIIKIAGALYLIYIGYKSLTSKSSPIEKESAGANKKSLTNMEAIKVGFITNVTNPKATLFFLSLFTVVISQSTPFWLKLSMGAEMSVVTFAWFALVAIILSHRLVKQRIDKIQHYAEKFIGVVLIVLGIKVALSA